MKQIIKSDTDKVSAHNQSVDEIAAVYHDGVLIVVDFTDVCQSDYSHIEFKQLYTRNMLTRIALWIRCNIVLVDVSAAAADQSTLIHSDPVGGNVGQNLMDT